MLRDFSARIRRAAIGLAVMAAVGVAPLAACGVRGPLTLPPPSTEAGAPTSETPGAAPTPAPQPRERKP